MQFSENWLRTLVDPDLSSDALAGALTMAGLEVESTVPAAAAFSGVVVARVLAAEPHPNADRLRVCRVDAGTGQELSIVCGAPNVAVGQLVPCALEGAMLPGGLAIRRASMRGVESQGMLCSAKELGLSDDASGLLILGDDARIGADLRAALELDDRVVTLKITPNRADCLSLTGIAREVAAITGAPLAEVAIAPVPVSIDASRPVRVEEPSACPRFCARVIRGIDASAPTPDWMKRRLERGGIRSISAVVDVTNYVMLELGQPLHAYDSALLEGGIVVRFPRPGETLTLLNGQVLALDPDQLLVCDGKKPLGLAGIMGGEHSGIGAATTEVFLEGAFWSPDVIQGRSRRLGFASDAGYRFERGVDFGGCARGVERATELIIALCGGSAGPLSDVVATLPARRPIRVRASRLRRLLGMDIPDATIAGIFRRLALPFDSTPDGWTVTAPTHRFDLVIEEDLVEEVARIHGYEKIPTQAARHAQTMLRDPEGARTAWDVRDRLVARDYQEIITFSFVAADWERDFAGSSDPVHVTNPIASHLDVMRSTLIGGLIATLSSNLARRHPRVRLFEVGRTFRRLETGALPFAQPLIVGGLAWGPAAPEQWGTPQRTVDFFDVKGDLEALLHPGTLITRPAPHPALHPGRSAIVEFDGRTVGFLGEVHPRWVRKYELPSAPVVFEVELAAALAAAVPAARSISRLPPARRDIAVIVDEAVAAGSVLAALERARPPAVTAIRIFDVYRGANLPSGKKSLAILVLMQDTERTLTDAEIDENKRMLVEVLQREFQATLRQ